MKIKSFCAGTFCAVLVILSCISFPALAATDGGGTVTVSGVDFSTTTELKNRQQSDRPWGSYTVSGSQNSIAAAGCGVLAVSNALHYATGYFPDPAQLGEWANRNNAGYNGDWTEGTIFFSRFVNEFGDALGFHTAVHDDREGSQNLCRVRTFVNDIDAKDTLIGFIRCGGALVAYVENHFIAIVDYDPMTDRFLVWDNNAGDKNGGRRAGITHAEGDRFTWKEMRGTQKNASGEEFQFCIEYVVPILPTEGRQMRFVSRDALTSGSLRLQQPGKCCNFTPVNVMELDGQSLVFSGSYTSRGQIERVGYRVNGGETVFLPDAMTDASEDARNEGRLWCGEDAATVGFRVSVPVRASDKRYDIIVSVDGVEKVVWTAVASAKYAGEPIVTEESDTDNGSGTYAEPASAESAAGTEAATDPTQTKKAGRVFLIPVAAAVGAVCAACVPIVLKTVGDTKRRRLLLVTAAGILCVGLAAVLVVCITDPGTGSEPDETSPVPAASDTTGMRSEETVTGSADMADSLYESAVSRMNAGDYAGALGLFAQIQDHRDSRSRMADCEKHLLTDADVGSVIRFGTCEQDNDPDNGQELIEWRVLEKKDGRLLVISEKALDCLPYNETFWSTTWERSTLRSWLNRTFIGEAFTDAEQSMIVKTRIAADENPDYDTPPGSGTSDKLFLLSVTEAAQYLPTVRDRRCRPTPYAVARGAWTTGMLTETDAPACCWWLRTPGGTVFDAAFVHYRGTISTGGRRVMSVSTACVRPAMWIRADGE